MALTDKLVAIGDAIREKNGTTELIPLADMPQAILDIVSGIKLLDHTVTFLSDGEPYEIVSVKSGNSVNAPAIDPISESGSFAGWQFNGETVGFPYPLESDVELVAKFGTLSDTLYKHFGISKNEYPCMAVTYIPTYNNWLIRFLTTATTEKGKINYIGNILQQSNLKMNVTDFADVNSVVNSVIEKNTPNLTPKTQATWTYFGCDKDPVYANFDLTATENPQGYKI